MLGQKYMQHLPTCNKMQDWSEAEDAFAATPDYLRDFNYYIAREEMDEKRNTCTCGLEKLLNSEQNPEECDASKADQGEGAGKQISMATK